MSAAHAELLLASLYTDHDVRRAFLRDPDSVISLFELDASERQSFIEIDRPGLVLAANCFSYKRWKATQRRHLLSRQFVSYTHLFDADLLGRARKLLDARIGAGLFSQRPRELTPHGLVSDLLSAMPGNQINHEHAFLESPHLAVLGPIWQRLFGLHLRDHHLVRLYFLRLSESAPQDAMTLHPRPGTYTTYVPLGPDAFKSALRIEYGDGASPRYFPLTSGTVVTVPSDVRQVVEIGSCRTPEQGYAFLCVKTLSAAV
jgi:hypothetical protein